MRTNAKVPPTLILQTCNWTSLHLPINSHLFRVAGALQPIAAIVRWEAGCTVNSCSADCQEGKHSHLWDIWSLQLNQWFSAPTALLTFQLPQVNHWVRLTACLWTCGLGIQNEVRLLVRRRCWQKTALCLCLPKTSGWYNTINKKVFIVCFEKRHIKVNNLNTQVQGPKTAIQLFYSGKGTEVITSAVRKGGADFNLVTYVN